MVKPGMLQLSERNLQANIYLALAFSKLNIPSVLSLRYILCTISNYQARQGRKALDAQVGPFQLLQELLCRDTAHVAHVYLNQRRLGRDERAVWIAVKGYELYVLRYPHGQLRGGSGESISQQVAAAYDGLWPVVRIQERSGGLASSLQRAVPFPARPVASA